MKPKFIKYFMSVAEQTALLSNCNRRKVGAIIVSSDFTSIFSFGYNGQPAGLPNCCEDSNNITLSSVVHAEDNAINYAKKFNHSTNNAILFVTLSPCVNCANLIINANISTVYYKEKYKCLEGLSLLEKNNITCIQVGDAHES